MKCLKELLQDKSRNRKYRCLEGSGLIQRKKSNAAAGSYTFSFFLPQQPLQKCYYLCTALLLFLSLFFSQDEQESGVSCK